MARVVLIEDEPDLREILQYNLTQAGHRVQTAGTAEAGLRLARDTLPDIVLLDLMLPDRPGTTVCTALRREPRTQDIPIIMVTAKGEEVDRIVGLELGADDYLVKPFSVRELVLRMNAVLRRGDAKEPVLRRERVQTRSTLLGDVWELDPGVSSRTVDTHVKRLRDKLGTAGRFIQTVRGVGYRFSERQAEAEI